MKNLLPMKCFKITVFLFILSVQAGLAQEAKDTLAPQKSAQRVVASPANTGNNLSSQFYSLKNKSNSYQEYKVVKETTLNAFWRNVQDTLTQARKQLQTIQSNTDNQLKSVQDKINGQQAELTRLKASVAERDQKLETISYNTDRINVFGINLLKNSYIYLNLAIISTLLLLLAGAIYKYRNSNKIAVARVNDFESIKSELNGYKQKLRERETIMGRELQTERNKIEELNQVIASLKKKVH